MVGPANGATLDVSGDPDTEAVISWTETQNPPGDVTYEWQLGLRSVGNFDDPLAAIASDNGGIATTLTVTFGDLAALLTSLGVEIGETVEAIWRVVATSEDQTASSVDTFDIDITRGEILSLEQNALSKEMMIYPNPADQVAYLRLGEVPAGTMNIRIVNQLGQTIRSVSAAAQSGQQVELPLSGIPSGVYFTVVSVGHLQGVQRLVIQ